MRAVRYYVLTELDGTKLRVSEFSINAYYQQSNFTRILGLGFNADVQETVEELDRLFNPIQPFRTADDDLAPWQ